MRRDKTVLLILTVFVLGTTGLGNAQEPGEPEIRRAEPASTPSSGVVMEPFLPAKPIPPPQVIPSPVTEEPAQRGEPQRVERAIPVAPAERVEPARPVPSVPERSFQESPPPLPEPGAGEIRVAPTQSEPSIVGTPPDKVQFDAANELYRIEEWPQAIAAYDLLMRNFPDTPYREAALYRSGSAYRKLGQDRVARTYFLTLLREFTVGEFVGPAAYRLAEQYFEEKDYPEAMRLFRLAAGRIETPELKLAARFFQARCAQLTGRDVEAGELFEQVAEAPDPNPYREYSLITLARMASDRGRKDEALRIYQKISSTSKDANLKAEATVKAAVTALELGQLDLAEKLFARSLELPGIGSYRELAIAGRLRTLYDAKRYSEVVSLVEQIDTIKSDTLAPDALLLGANAARQAGRADLAAALYNRLATDFPATPQANEARFQRLVGLYNSRDPSLPDALDDFIASESDPVQKAQARLMKGELHYLAGEFDKAIAEYESLSGGVLPERFVPEMLFKLGWCYAQKKDLPKAIDTLTTFLTQYPKHALAPAAIAQRALCLREAKRYQEALADFNYLIATYPKAPERELALVEKGLLHGQVDDIPNMVVNLRQVLKEYPQSREAARVNYWLGWAAFEQKDYKAAVAPLRAARDANPKDYGARATLRLILSLFYLEDVNEVAAEVTKYQPGENDPLVPHSIYRWLGQQLHDRGDYQRGADFLSKITSLENVATAEDWLFLARCKVQLGAWNEALSSVEAGLKLAGEPEAKARLMLERGRAETGLQQYDLALKSIAEVLTIAPEGPLNAEGLILQGDVEVARGAFEEAAKAYVRVALLFDDPAITPRALEKAYVCYKTLGNDAEAKRVLNDLKTRFPEHRMGAETAATNPSG